jgi:hypothetical protein
LREQLQHARERDQGRQTHWAREVGRLRERVVGVEGLPKNEAAAGEGAPLLQQDVEAAEVQAGRLEMLLRAFGPATGNPRSAAWMPSDHNVRGAPNLHSFHVATSATAR